ncbi:MAG: UDP-glucose 4-epimerase GalE, partial [Thermodesulfobacteriaceae bacterium]|nr:UDP-glucose 4-epimerase GalE [Thermodesulfobacteriaceae bacterium]
CIRDFIHVMDLAEAHILAMEYLLENEVSEILNCGYGKGYSVREVISMVKEVTKVDFEVRESGRREGDPPILIADNRKIKNLLNFNPKFDDLATIIKDTFNWELKQS